MNRFQTGSIITILVGTGFIFLILTDVTPFWECNNVYHNEFQQNICFEMSLRSVLFLGGMSYGGAIFIFLWDRKISKEESQSFQKVNEN